ncbi:hypothetical protein KFE25_000442 [Diacronema lutheri]|uniref:Uncharacterized protein n=1 Tax=Diacronema lutheri TaxID=2081491 RepID=A0A8J5XE92_DIALT|nr:hypothetical protein KFE25_000442 [Diacronema lutheri]
MLCAGPTAARRAALAALLLCAVPARAAPRGAALRARGGANTPALAAAGALGAAREALSRAPVQKCLELGTIAAFGALTRERLDGRALTDLLLRALVPALVLASLAATEASRDLARYCAAGGALVLWQFAAAHVAARALLGGGGGAARAAARRTASVQLGTMSPAVSSFAFIREFAGTERTGHAALADLPNKAYALLLLPLVLALRAEPAARVAMRARGAHARGALADPLNAAIVAGLALAACGVRLEGLSFVGAAVRSLASAQAPVLFLLVGVRWHVAGARRPLVLALLLARHGLVALGAAAFFRVARVRDESARLAAVLLSQAASSLIALGHIDRAARAGLGYDAELAFEIVALSFPLSIALNAAACVGGARYVANLPAVGGGLLAASAAVHAASRRRINALLL